MQVVEIAPEVNINKVPEIGMIGTVGSYQTANTLA